MNAYSGLSGGVRRLGEGQRATSLDGLEPKPIFLHGMWRCGSTFFWSRFRAETQTRCFYEPLHHGLAKLSLARIARDTADQVLANRHPELEAPYFQEFAPLVRGRGVKGFHTSLAYHRYFLQPGERHGALKAYLEGLVAAARADNRVAVLGFNRTLGRIGWLQANFTAANIYIDREPSAIWASYRAELAKDNRAFFAMWLRVLDANADHPLLQPVIERLGLGAGVAAPFGSQRRRHHRLIERMNDAESYFLIFYLWLVCTRHAFAHSDLVIDTRLANVDAYRRRLEADIEGLAGVRVNLANMRAADPRLGLPKAVQLQVERSALELFPRAARAKAEDRIAGLARVSARAAELISRVA